jgi:hypothetical protein
MKTITPPITNPDLTICPLCLQLVAIIYYEVHLQVHDQAEMLADILALSRR